MTETILSGVAPGTIENQSWSHTFVDRSVVIPNGAVVSKLGIYRISAGTVSVKIARETSSTTYDILITESFSHPGGGMVDFTLSSPFTVPETGTHRLSCHAVAPQTQSSSAARATKSGNVTGTGQGGFSVTTAPLVAMRATLVTNGGGDPPPPGPQHYIHLVAGQSNALQIGSGTVFLNKLQELVPNATHQVVNTAVGSSYIVPHPNNSNNVHWQPGGGLVENTVTALNSALAATPGSIMGLAIWLHGEAQARAGLETTILHYPEHLRVVFGYIESNVSGLGPKWIIVELWNQPDSSFPLWTHMQFMQRKMCEADPFANVFGALPVSVAGMGGGLHPGSTVLNVVQTKSAEVGAPYLTP